MALVALDRQHVGKPGKPGDLGAECKPRFSWEAYLTAEYLLAAEKELRRLGHDVIPISDGRNRDRHERFNNYASRYMGPSCYIAAHFNAGGGDYGASFFDARSSLGERLAVRIKTEFNKEMPDLGRFRIIKSRPSDWTSNAFATIKGVWTGPACGICFEPAFLDNPWHVKLLDSDGLQLMGRTLARAIDEWAQSI